MLYPLWRIDIHFPPVVLKLLVMVGSGAEGRQGTWEGVFRFEAATEEQNHHRIGRGMGKSLLEQLPGIVAAGKRQAGQIL